MCSIDAADAASDGLLAQYASNPHSVVGSAICLTALVHTNGKVGSVPASDFDISLAQHYIKMVDAEMPTVTLNLLAAQSMIILCTEKETETWGTATGSCCTCK